LFREHYPLEYRTAFSDAGTRGGGPNSRRMGFDPPLARALEEQLGLRWESGKILMEYLMVDQVEKLSEN
jgi:uncharacterized protein (TIGR03435 family)